VRVWQEKVYVGSIFHDELSLEERRDRIVEQLRKSRFCADSEDVQLLVDELSEVDTVRYFDQVWDALYDQADAAGVWLDTFELSKP
jgi:hypothetical protein